MHTIVENNSICSRFVCNVFYVFVICQCVYRAKSRLFGWRDRAARRFADTHARTVSQHKHVRHILHTHQFLACVHASQTIFRSERRKAVAIYRRGVSSENSRCKMRVKTYESVGTCEENRNRNTIYLIHNNNNNNSDIFLNSLCHKRGPKLLPKPPVCLSAHVAKMMRVLHSLCGNCFTRFFVSAHHRLLR